MAPVKKPRANKLHQAKEDKKEEPQIKSESVVSAQLQKKINKKKQQQLKKKPRGVVFIKHLPHGFFEKQLEKYFKQFGNVTRVRLVRSRRTGNSKGYAFIEFEYPEVAEVAAETMNNYLMFKKLIKASYIPPEKQEFNYFRTSLKQIRNKSGKVVWVSSKTAAIQQKVKNHNDWSEESYQNRTQRQIDKVKKMAKKYAHLGIDINKIVAHPKPFIEHDRKIRKSKAVTKEKVLNSKINKRKVIKELSFFQKPSLEDLLGNTIQEDSEDEDYINECSDEEVERDVESSAEESCGSMKSTDEEENESEAEEYHVPLVAKKLQNNFGKSLKPSNVERLDQMLKRKPHTGGVKKLKKSLKQPNVFKNKSKQQVVAAKELAKPLSNVKSKLKNEQKGKKYKKKVK